MNGILNGFLSPGGITSPTAISGLFLWLDGSDTSTMFDTTVGGSVSAANAAVKRWEDKSGNANHASNNATGIVRKDNIRNGRTVLRWNGSTIYTLATPFSGNTWTIFAVLKNTDATNGSMILGKTGNADQYLFEGLNSPTYGTASGVTVAESDPDGGFNMLTAQSTGTVIQLWANSVSANGTTPDTTNIVFDKVGHYDTADNIMEGDVAEIIAYNVALSSANRSLVEGYLSARWGPLGE